MERFRKSSGRGATMLGFGSPGGVDFICGTCKSRKNVVELPVPGLKEAISNAKMVVPLIQLLCIITTYSFALQIENGLAIAKPEAMDLFMEKEEDVQALRGTSAFSMLAFAVENNQKKLKFASGVGLFSLYFRLRQMTYVRPRSERQSPGSRCGRDDYSARREAVKESRT